jgi:hypothetical protein
MSHIFASGLYLLACCHGRSLLVGGLRAALPSPSTEEGGVYDEAPGTSIEFVAKVDFKLLGDQMPFWYLKVLREGH